VTSDNLDILLPPDVLKSCAINTQFQI